MELIENLEVHPTSEVIWNDPDMQDEWGEKVKQARRVHQTMEYEMVKEKIRKCATMHIAPRNYDKQIERIQKDGLVWLPVQRTKSYNGFSHKHFPSDKIDMNTNVYGVLSYKMEYAERFREVSGTQNTDHHVIGDLLGFPECCSKFFTEIWGDGYYDPLYQIAKNSEHEQIDERTLKVKPHIATIQYMRYAGFRLTSHFPCSLECKESIAVGKDWYDLTKEKEPLGMDYLEEILSLDTEWSVLHGVATVTTYPFTLLANSLPTKKEWKVIWDEVKTY